MNKKIKILSLTLIATSLTSCSYLNNNLSTKANNAANPSNSTTQNSNVTAQTQPKDELEKLSVIDLINKQKEAMSKLTSYQIDMSVNQKMNDNGKVTENKIDKKIEMDIKKKLQHSIITENGVKSEIYLADSIAYQLMGDKWVQQPIPKDSFESVFAFPVTKSENVKNVDNFVVDTKDGVYKITPIKPITMTQFFELVDGSKAQPLPEGIEDTTEMTFEYIINKDFTQKSLKIDMTEKTSKTTVNSQQTFSNFNNIPAIVVPDEAKKAPSKEKN